jgi:GGDEF domain-containing protein
MAGRGHKRRRSDAQERIREAFLVQAGEQLVELVALAQERDEAMIDSVAADLERLADTAEALSMGQLARAARKSARAVHGDKPIDSLRLVAQALRRTTGPRRLGPILVVGDRRSTAALGSQTARCTEPVRTFPSLHDFTAALHVDEPSAVCLPVEAHDAVRQLVQYESFPVLVHALPGDFEGVARAMSAGAVGYVERPLDATELCRQARWRSLPRLDVLRVFLLAEADDTRAGLHAAFETASLATQVSDDPDDLGRALGDGGLDAVVLGPEVNGVPCSTLAGIVRGHPRCGHLPLMVIGRPKRPATLRSSGIDDVMRASADPHHVAQRIRDRVHRFQMLPWRDHPTFHLHNRLGLLGAFDRLLADAERHRTPLAAAVITLDGLHRADPRELPELEQAARRGFAKASQDLLRSTDVAGELRPGDYLVGLPGATADDAASRMERLVAALDGTFATQELTRTLRARSGVADVSLGVAGLALRAETDLTTGS